jgi:uncharacterized cupredoxin-like copper-binding protein
MLRAIALAQDPALPAWVTVDAPGKTVRLSLEAATLPHDTLVGLNGERQGSVQVVVPLNWTVQWAWVNGDSSANHSLVVMAEREKLPLEGGRPAMDNAWSRSVLPGLKPGQKDNTTFIADQVGWYWVLCGVPGHAIAGEWIGLKVDRDASTVSVVRKSS